MEALKLLRRKNGDLRDGGFSAKEVSDRIYGVSSDFICSIDDGCRPFMEDLIAYVMATGIKIDEIKLSSAVDPIVKITITHNEEQSLMMEGMSDAEVGRLLGRLSIGATDSNNSNGM